MTKKELQRKELLTISGNDINNYNIEKKEYNAKIIKSGEQVEVLIYETWPTNSHNKRVGINPTREEQRNLNEKNAKLNCIRKMNTNFTNKDSWITLTYTNDNMPETEQAAKKDISNYLLRVKRKTKKDIKYMYTIEVSKKGRIHHHLVINVNDRDLLEDTWCNAKETARKRKNPNYNIKKLGRTTARRLQKDDFGLTGLAMYISKDSEHNKKRFVCSKNLTPPEIKTTKSLKGRKLSKRFIKKLHDDPVAAKQELLKLFPDCQLNEVKSKIAYYSNSFYIYANLKKVH